MGAETMKKHGGAGRGQGRKPLPAGQRRVKHQVFLSPSCSAWLVAEAVRRDIKEGAVLDEVLAPFSGPEQ